MVSRMLPSQRAITVHRRQTLEGLIGSLISLLAFMVAGLAALALFVRPETLIWIVGLFSAAFGLGARAWWPTFWPAAAFSSATRSPSAKRLN